MSNRQYIVAERTRNVRNRNTYTRLLQRAFGPGARVVCSHHILVCTGPKARERVFEIPSADTALFCPRIMRRAFGDRASTYMTELAQTPPNRREARVRHWLRASAQESLR